MERLSQSLHNRNLQQGRPHHDLGSLVLLIDPPGLLERPTFGIEGVVGLQQAKFGEDPQVGLVCRFEANRPYGLSDLV
jgi:hypothetical protein